MRHNAQCAKMALMGRRETYTAQKAAELLKMPRSTLTQRATRRGIGAHNGRAWAFTKSDLKLLAKAGPRGAHSHK